MVIFQLSKTILPPPIDENKSRAELVSELVLLRQQLFLKENFDSFFVSMFTYSPVTMAIISFPDGRFIAVNRVFTTLFEYPANEVIDRTSSQLGLYENSRDQQAIYEQLKSERKIYNSEQYLLTKSGKRKALLVSYSLYSEKKRDYAIVWAIDISKQKKIEHALRLSEKRNQCFLNSIPDLMLIYEKSGLCIDFNAGKNVHKILSKKDCIGKNVKDVMPPTTANLILNVIEEALKTNETQTIEHAFAFRGVHYVLEARVSKLNETQALLMVRDVTQFKSLQDELQRIDRLHLVGETAAGIGHEVRNPLTTIRGFIQLLSTKPECEKYASYFMLILEELDRTNKILDEFLSLSRNQSTDFSLQQLNTVLTTLYPLLNADAILQSKLLQLDLQPDLPKIHLNLGEIRQLVFNLVRNGLESMKANGHLTISTYCEKETVVLAIQDEGPGISHEQLGKIGSRFSTTKKNGTGLGLPICYNIAEHHNAVITIDTSESGTTFYIHFPIRTEPTLHKT